MSIEVVTKISGNQYWDLLFDRSSLRASALSAELLLLIMDTICWSLTPICFWIVFVSHQRNYNIISAFFISFSLVMYAFARLLLSLRVLQRPSAYKGCYWRQTRIIDRKLYVNYLIYICTWWQLEVWTSVHLQLDLMLSSMYPFELSIIFYLYRFYDQASKIHLIIKTV